MSRSSYSFTQGSDIAGSPFTASSFKDCLLQCDNSDYCNYMSFDSLKFESNCAMFERGGVISVDYLKADANIDSAKALVAQTGGSGGSLSPDVSACPSTTAGTCSSGTLKTYHYNKPPAKAFTYTGACTTRYASSNPAKVSTLTVNTFLQCLDACDVSIPFSLTFVWL